MSKEVTLDLSNIVSPEEVAKFLEMLAGMVRAGNYQKLLDNHTFFSSEGDGWGMENTCINFKSIYGKDGRSDDVFDIGDVMESLKHRDRLKKDAVDKLKGEIAQVEKM